jgi:HEAT repeat protein
MAATRTRTASLALALVVVGLARADDDQVRRDEETVREAGVAVDGPSLLAFLRKNTSSDADTAAVERLIRELGDDSFRVREQATGRLTAVGARAVALLRKAVENGDCEVRYRAARCLREIEAGSTAAVLGATVRLLGERKPDGAAAALLAYLPLAEQEDVKESAVEALAALAVRDGKPDPVVVAALADKSADRRAAAGVALARSKRDDVRPDVRKLLKDPEAHVRMKVGLALAAAGDKESLEPLVAVLEELPPSQTALVEDLLYRLAGDKAPELSAGTTAEERKKYRAAWDDWLKANRGTVDLAKVGDDLRPRGHTLIVLLDDGAVADLDADKKPRFKVDGIAFPLDAQYLPGDRVLVAEYEGSRVSERSRTGEVLWQRRVAEPLAAQRLPNGHTFIANATQLIEVDRTGREVLSLPAPQGSRVMKAQRLPNGHVACIAQLAGTRYYLLDRDGKVLRSFGVELKTSGGRVDVLPNGHVLVPERDSNRVVEYDTKGKPVWWLTFDQPVAAVRLANGHTLVTGMSQRKAVEFNRRGNPVWEYSTNTRVTRAFRH